MSMRSLNDRVTAMEARLDKINETVTALLQDGRTRRYTRSSAPRDAEPSWAKDIRTMLQSCSAEIREWKEERFTTMSDEHGVTRTQPEANVGVRTATSPQGSSTATSLLATPDEAQGHMAALRLDPYSGPFYLSLTEMGENLTPNFAKFFADTTFAGRIRTELRPVDWSNLLGRIKVPHGHDHCAVEFEARQGFSKLRLSRSTDFEPPQLPRSVAMPSDAEVKNFLEDMATNPPKERIPYYVGPALTSDLDGILHPGEALSELPHLEGVNDYYIHFGARFSGTAFHKEDEGFRSCNTVYSGIKIFITIQPGDTDKFEELVRRRWNCGTCSQFVRHLSLIIGPQKLRDEGIKSDIHILGPGDMIVTEPNQYHAVINFTSCFAISTNFTLPGEPAPLDTLPVCSWCGLYALGGHRVPSPDGEMERPGRQRTKPRKPPDALRNRVPKRMRSTRTFSELSEVEKQIRAVDKLCNIPTYSAESPPSPDVLKLVAAIRSRPAVAQLCSLIRQKRDLNIEHRRPALEGHLERSINRLALRESKRGFEKFQTRLAQVDHAEAVQIARNGMERTPSKLVEEFRKKARMSKRTLENHRAKGDKWKALCGPYDGLLCFIFLSPNDFGIPAASYLDITNLDLFRTLLDDGYTRRICSAAKAFQDSLEGDDVEFRWESSDICLQTCGEDEMLSLLQPLPFTDENIWDPDKFSRWDRPSGWPSEWPWPADPTALTDDEKPCDYCDGAKCECSNTLPDMVPRIKNYGGKGRGLQAIAREPGGVAYSKGSFLGVLTGQVAPCTQFDDHWTLDFTRPDLPDEPVICQIWVAEVSNCFRLLNHAQDPSARLISKKRRGRYVTVVEARRKIMDGEEITVSYGRGFAKLAQGLC